MHEVQLEPGVEMLEDAARQARSAVVLGHGGGSDCFLASIVGEYLQKLGVETVLLGGIACQWWPEPGLTGELLRVVGPDLYDPTQLTGVEVVHDYAVIVGPDAKMPDGRIPHEAVLAAYTGQPTFILSHLGGVKGSTAGLAEIIQRVSAGLVVTVDVGSDTLSTGNETRPVQTAFADHLTLAAVANQPIARFFCLAGYGADAEMELEELDRNFSAVLRGGGLRGAVVPSPKAIADLEALHGTEGDPIGNLVAKACRGEFGLHRVNKESPWGQVAHIGPAAIPIWVMDPATVIREVASDVQKIMGTTSLAEAEQIYLDAGRLPETRIARMMDFGRPRSPASTRSMPGGALPTCGSPAGP
jgi:hypothetical protein